MEQSNSNSDMVNKDSVDTENSTVSEGSSSADQRSTTADHSMSATNTSILKTMMEQHTVLLQAIQDMQNGGKATNGETSLVDDQVEENNGAPLSYGLKEVSSEGDTSDEDEMMDICKLYDNDDSVGPNVNEKLAQNINISFKKRLSKENQTKISEKFQRPANCDSLTIPKVNIEIWEEANSHLRVKDIHLAKVQSLVNKAAVPIIQMAQKCLDKDKKGINVSQCTDALVLLASAATELTQHQFDDDKDKDGKKPGKLPLAASQKRKSGATKIEWIADKKKRQNVKHARKKGAIKKVREYAIMTGETAYVHLSDDYYDGLEDSVQRTEEGILIPPRPSRRCPLCHHLPSSVKPTSAPSATVTAPPSATVTAPPPSATVTAPPSDTATVPSMSSSQQYAQHGSSGQPDSGPNCTNTLLSPRAAVRTRKPQVCTINQGVQCCLGETTTRTPGSDRSCRICGALFETQTRHQQSLWMACEQPDCDYWLEAKCFF